MEKKDGVYYVPCKVNGLELKFIFDTGAGDVSISLSEAIFMIKNGYMSENDLIGTEYYRIANGELTEGTAINIKEIKIGDRILHNVKASIIHSSSAPILLGQSAIEKFGKYSVDYSNNTLNIGDPAKKEDHVANISDYSKPWLPFADLQAGISLKYPPDWENRTDESGRIFFTSPREGEKDPFRENLNIGYKSDEAYTSMLMLEPAFKTLPGQLQKSFNDFKVEKEGYIKMNGLDIYEIIYTGKMKDQETQKLRFIQWFCVHDSKLYTITYSADAMNKSFTNIAQNIMRGITFKQ